MTCKTDCLVNVTFSRAEISYLCCTTEYETWRVELSGSENYVFTNDSPSLDILPGTYSTSVSYTCKLGTSNTRKAYVRVGSNWVTSITVPYTTYKQSFQFGCQ